MTPLLGPATPRQPARTTRNSVLFLGASPPAVDADSAGSMCGSRPGLATRSIHDKWVRSASRRRVAGGPRTTVRTGPSLGLPPAPTRNPPREGAGKVGPRRCSHEPHTEARSLGGQGAMTTAVRSDEPVTALVTQVTYQAVITVLDGSAVVWGDLYGAANRAHSTTHKLKSEPPASPSTKEQA
jgi:hypothetical protein